MKLTYGIINGVKSLRSIGRSDLVHFVWRREVCSTTVFFTVPMHCICILQTQIVFGNSKHCITDQAYP